MSLRTQNLKNRDLKDKIKKVVLEVCAEENVEPVNRYNIFFAGKNTGEQVKLPDEKSSAWEKVTLRISAVYNLNVSFTHRNMYLTVKE